MKTNKKFQSAIVSLLFMLFVIWMTSDPPFRPLKKHVDIENPGSPLLGTLLTESEVSGDWSWDDIYITQTNSQPTDANFYLSDWASQVLLGNYEEKPASILQRIWLYSNSGQDLYQKIIERVSFSSRFDVDEKNMIEIPITPMGEYSENFCALSLSDSNKDIFCTTHWWNGNTLSEITVNLPVDMPKEEVAAIVNLIIATVDKKIEASQ